MNGTGKQLRGNATELTAIAPIKAGRLNALREVLAHADRETVARMKTIHYARWVIIDGGTRLLFTSNYDGGLEGYLEEFAECDEEPLNRIFGHCEGWPGARPAEGFIRYVREHQIEAEYFYSAYPKNTVREILRAMSWKQTTEKFIKAAQASKPDYEGLVKAYLDLLAAPTP